MKKFNGKIIVYASTSTLRRRINGISAATEKLAKKLGLKVEFITLREKFSSVYVYYKGCKGEAVPIYYNGNKQQTAEEIFEKLRNMIFVLSFHPKYSILKRKRKMIIQLS
ncbi:hypothetical protein J7L49_02035 [Candidatus Bathyarchaeota archaeon]|nr:hypothetical protein [Candidatus Bathyarchaeota archaeon]